VFNNVASAKKAAQVYGARRPNETRGARPRHSLTTEDFFQLFNSGIPHIRIAELTGLSRERIRQIFNRDFRDLFGGESGRKRFSTYTQKKRAAQAYQNAKERERKIFYELKPIIERARDAGCTVDFIFRKKNRNTKREIEPRLLAINGHRCLIYPSVSRATAPAQSCKRRYLWITASYHSLSHVRAVVIRTKARKHAVHIFVIPSKILLKAYFTPFKQRTTLHFCVEKLPPYQNQFPRVDYWKYENAWQLLGSKQTQTRQR